MDPQRYLLICGLDGHRDLLEAHAPRLFPDQPVTIFDHARDRAEGGVEGLADRALARLDADGGRGPTIVCGESFGGAIALAFARRHPERVKGLILLSTFGWYPMLGSLCGEAGLLAWRLLGDRVADRILRLSRPLGVPGALVTRCEADLRHAFLGLQVRDLDAYRAKCRLAVRFDARPWLHELRMPAFILTGSWDPIVPTSAGRDLARRLPNAELHRLRGGHLVHFVQVEEARRRIQDWLARTFAHLASRSVA